MNKKNRKIFSDMVIKHDQSWASIEEMIAWIDRYAKEYIKMLKKNKGLVVGDVWLGKPNNPVVIIDIKNGYVLYKYSTGSTSTEKIGSFKRLYKKEYV